MFESDHKLRHLPFFEFIASREETDPHWQTATAGLVVLRLVDARIHDGFASSADDWAVVSIRSTIDQVSDGAPIRTLLHRVVDAIGERDNRRILSPLMAYAQALEFDAQFALAADVYHTVLSHLDPSGDMDTAIAAHLKLAHCYRDLNQLGDAVLALTSASDLASSVGDIMGVLRARVEQARIDFVRGNIPSAEEILDDAIRRADGPELRDVRTRALHERSNVARNRGQYELAIQLAYQALEHSEGDRQRDRILGDIALGFMDLGVYSAARDAYMILSATAQEQYVRWASTLNLLEIAALTGAQTLFELYRRQLSSQPLPPRMATAYQLNTGMAYQRFSQHEKARDYLQRAFAMAGEHGFNKYLFEAEEALRSLGATLPPLPAPAMLSLDTEEVAAKIHQLREFSVTG